MADKQLFERLSQGIGKRALAMMEVFPFFIVGELVDVEEDHLDIVAESGVALELVGHKFDISLDSISAIYVEEFDGQIPTLK